MKERREGWGLYSLRDRQWKRTRDGKIDRYESFKCALECAEGHKDNPLQWSPRRFYLVKKFANRAELTKRVIDAAREYRRIEGQYGGTDEQFEGWKTLNCALKEYDGEQITREDM